MEQDKSKREGGTGFQPVLSFQIAREWMGLDMSPV
jgi:hypothetical protein